ncbi:MAG TPA: type II toxin-antitoxin system RelE/ParE family toxin, partial [Chloroflexota bacterium]|nr:type II toxin-antitoxin system RelE/ParE family toxin [Chloroflexota bacterium]
TSDAEFDLDEIKAYLIQQGGKRLAQYVLREIREAFRFLAATPEAGHRREDLTSAPLKFWSVFSYLIVYDPAKHPIEIMNVIHGARDVLSILEDDP